MKEQSAFPSRRGRREAEPPPKSFLLRTLVSRGSRSPKLLDFTPPRGETCSTRSPRRRANRSPKLPSSQARRRKSKHPSTPAAPRATSGPAGSFLVAADRGRTTSSSSRAPAFSKSVVPKQTRRLFFLVMILPQVHLRKPCYDFYFL